MSGTITLAELLSGRNFSLFSHPCSICGKPVRLIKETPMDANGRAVHEECQRYAHYRDAA
jgi:hypothetical protein